ncbi:MAG: TetR/AcrR family transcriptional regulator [Bdellovibrionaceae bacterium]|jgi:AcrR family transcriptional regulator|nr:TetR/AcrR family transcriptional regulator [Pseudobdellovibrionaceae bacterium]
MTKKEANKNTKEKILEEASGLFAKHGFAATSVREIAGKANVNLASINYHFKNKENLYQEVFEYNYEFIKQAVHQCGKKTNTTEELTVAVFQLFLSKEAAVMNTFKMFLSDNVPDEGNEYNFEKEDQIGPPGSSEFIEKINNDLDGEYSEESKLWAVKMIFSLLIHFGVVLNTALMKRRCKASKDISPEKVEQHLRHTVRSYLMYIKETSEFY